MGNHMEDMEDDEKEGNFWEDLVDVNNTSKGIYRLREDTDNIPFTHNEDKDN